MKLERAERDCIRLERGSLDRDQYHMRVETQEYMRQKEAELDHLLKRKKIEMEKKLRRFLYAGKSAKSTANLVSMGVNVQICIRRFATKK